MDEVRAAVARAREAIEEAKARDVESAAAVSYDYYWDDPSPGHDDPEPDLDVMER